MAGNRDEALNWLRLAASDLALARLVVSNGEVALHHACYHARQCAEKALKAGLTLIDIDQPKSRNLDSVRDTFPGGWAVQTAFPDLEELTQWNVQGRSPGDWPEARSEDATTMIGMAEAILASIVGDFERRGIAVPGSG